MQRQIYLRRKSVSVTNEYCLLTSGTHPRLQRWIVVQRAVQRQLFEQLRRRQQQTICQRVRKRFTSNAHFILLNLLSEVLDNLALDVVQVVGCLCRTLRSDVQLYIMRRVHATLSPWIKVPLDFRDMLRRTRSVVGGSVAVDAVIRDRKIPVDLDIFCPRGARKEVVQYLIKNEHYRLDVILTDYVPEATHPHWGSFDIVNGILSCTRLSKMVPWGEHRQLMMVDVLESRDGYAVSPIIQSDATSGMTWIGADTISVLYPKWTLDLVSITRKRSHPNPHGGGARWMRRLARVKGFKVIDIWAWNDLRRERPCGTACPGILRFSDDNMCLSMQFAHGGEKFGTCFGTSQQRLPRRVFTLTGLGSLLCCHSVRCPNCRVYKAWELNQWYRQFYYTAISDAGGFIWMD